MNNKFMLFSLLSNYYCVSNLYFYLTNNNSMNENNPFRIIEEDHREIEILFERYDSYEETAYDEKQHTINEIMEMLELHTRMEETYCYPRFREAFVTENTNYVEEAYTEHVIAKTIIDELKFLEIENPEFDEKVKQLQDTIEHHVEEEENELLPLAEKHLEEEELEVMGNMMVMFKREHSMVGSLV